jgi:Zn-dependent protease
VKIFRIPIKAEMSFFVLAVFLGLSRARDLTLIVEWIAVVFVSVLVHEFGHALAGRAFGLEPEIRLYQMGGLTSWRSEKEVGPLRNLLISLAGPFAGFALGAGVLVFGRLFLRAAPTDLGATIYFDLLWVNIGWGICNLLPILPMDGGQVLATLERWLRKRSDGLISHVISLLAALAIAIAAFNWRALWIGFLGVYFAYLNGTVLFRQLQIYRDRHLHESLDDARAAVERDELDSALEILSQVRARARTDEVKEKAAHILIVVYLKQEKLEAAEAELRRYTVLFGGDSYLQGTLHFLKGEMVDALPDVKRAFEVYPEKQVGILLCKTLLGSGDLAAALELCGHPALAEVSWPLTVEVHAEAFERGDFKFSAATGVAAYQQKADPKLAYNVACAFSRDSNLSEALGWTRRAIETGFSDEQALRSDPDLDAIRSLPEFTALMKKFEQSRS